ncbi:DNA repair protein XRCC2 [Spea bombifrons]|uniref:DNA repair protein XRCC2 n=1 Tax=Spea bombifrons TaxID=233779 RepID=UPI0023498D47|nr:DNA repair protein XRCC2 [Spea bombifrons]
MSDGFRKAESGTQLLARLEGRSSLKELEPLLFADEGHPVHGDIIEFHGPEGTGKTEMFCHLISRCILPESEGGLQAEVVFIDTDHHFDILRLVTVLEHRLSQSNEETVKQCLARLYLLYCNSSVQLLLTLYSLENMFCSRPSLCLLIIDGLSAFYWIDRNNGGDSVWKQESNMKKCTELLDKLVKEYQLVLLASTQAIMQKSSGEGFEWFSSSSKPPSGPADYKPYLCKLWQNVTSHRIFFSKEPRTEGGDQTFSIVSCNLKNKNVMRRLFTVAESGVRFV